MTLLNMSLCGRTSFWTADQKLSILDLLAFFFTDSPRISLRTPSLFLKKTNKPKNPTRPASWSSKPSKTWFLHIPRLLASFGMFWRWAPGLPWAGCTRFKLTKVVVLSLVSSASCGWFCPRHVTPWSWPLEPWAESVTGDRVSVPGAEPPGGGSYWEDFF